MIKSCIIYRLILQGVLLIGLAMSKNEEERAPNGYQDSYPVVTCEAYHPVELALHAWLDDDSEQGGAGDDPHLLRLSWHQSGTFDKASGAFGSMSDAMHFSVVQQHEANGGMAGLLETLDPMYDDIIQAMCPHNTPQDNAEHPPISRADFYTLAGVVGLYRMDGPAIVWFPGRRDLQLGDPTCECLKDSPELPPEGSLPSGQVEGDRQEGGIFSRGDHRQTAVDNRNVFQRLGFTPREMTALIGAHAMGAMHREDSGYGFPSKEAKWTTNNLTFSNQFFKNLVDPGTGRWKVKEMPADKQLYVSKQGTSRVAMLPADLALLSLPSTEKWAERYALDEELFRTDFAAAYGKLLGLGVEQAPCPIPAELCVQP